MKTKTYTILIQREREVDVYATSSKQAQDIVRDLYISGDAVAELEDATFGCLSISEISEEDI